MKRLYFILFLITCLVPQELVPNHLAGGVITYECISGNTYVFTVSRYRDCAGPNLPNNTPIIANPVGSGNNINFTVNQVSISNMPPPQGNPCLTAPAGICYQEVVYQSGNITIPNSAGGYDIYFQDFARNQSVTNIINPGGVGMTTTIRIPDPGTYACNSSPNFVNFPPTIICLNDTFSFDHSATDPDGDVLSYYLCNAYSDAPNNPPFNVVPYAPKPGGGNYSGTYPIHANPAMTINPNTGVFKGKPILVGNYAVVVCVDEIRNGVVIGTYTREVQINVTACIANVTAAIQSEPPAAGAAYGSVLSCNNYTVNFVNTSQNSNTFFWDFGDPTVTTDTSSTIAPSYTYPDTGVYTAMLVATPGFPCADTVFVYVRVFPGMDANFGISEPHCVGFPIFFTDSSTSIFGIVSGWSWQFGNGPSSNLQNPVNTYPFQSTYNVRLIAEDTKGCKDTIIKPISVFTPPTANITQPLPICVGDSVTLQVTASAGTYSWAPAAGLSCTTCKQPKASPASNTIYTLSITGAGGCTNFATVLVIVTPPPIVNAGSDEFLCGVGFVQLQATVTSTTGYTVLWSPATGLDFTNILNPKASPATTTTYILAITSLNGCVIKDTLIVFVNSISIDAGSNQIICVGDTIQLNGTSVTPGMIYSWSPASSLSNPNISNPIAFPSSTTVYTLTATDPVSGCSGTDNVTITVSPPPPIDAGPNVIICVNTNTQLLATGGVSYQWDPDPSLSCTACSNPTATPVNTTKYYVTGTDANGCENRDSVTITIQQAPNASINPATITICRNTSTSLQALGGVQYNWAPGGSLSCTSCPNPVASPLTTTTYSVTVTDIIGCSSQATATVTVIQPQPINISPANPTICLGDTVQITANAVNAISYSWAPASTLTDPNIQNPGAFPSLNTVYTVTTTDGNGCTNTASILVTVNVLQAGSFSPDSAICIGDSYQLYANGFNTYNWLPSASLSCNNCSNPIATPIVTTTYTIHVADNFGCQDSGFVIVTINPLPTVTTSPDQTICINDSIQINANGGVSYSWAPAATVSNPNSQTTFVKPLSTTDYTVTVIDANSCENTGNVKITVRPLPIISAGPDVDICKFDNTQLSASGGISYVWSPGTALSCTNCPNPIATPLTDITYTVQGTDAFGCVNIDSVFVKVHSIQPGNISPDASICIGDNYQLFANGFTTYNWVPGATLSCTSCANPIATPAVTTTYTVYVTNSVGCQDSSFVTVTVNQLPTPTITAAPDSICLGKTSQLTATGGVNYSWLPVLGLTDPAIANPVADPLSTITYTVEVTDVNSCKNTATQLITVLPLPNISASPDAQICLGDSASLSAIGGISYTWTPNINLSCPSCPQSFAWPTVDVTYTVEGFDTYGCSNKDSVFVKVNSIQPGNISPDNAICIGDNYQLFANGFVNYNWWPSATLSCATCSNPVATPSVTTLYSVAVEDVNGCRDTGSVLVTVNPLPTVTVSPDTDICFGQSTNLTATGGTTYSWSPSAGLSCSNCPNPVASPASTIQYTVTVTDNNTCENTGTVTVTVNPLPNTDAGLDKTICFGDSTQLTATGAATYQWSPGSGLSCTNCPNPIAFPVATTNYTVIGTHVNGCTKNDEVTVTINQLPIPVITPDQSICIGDNLQLNVSGGTSYQWSPTTGLSCNTCTNPIATPQQTTTYRVRVFNGANCFKDDSVKITVASPAAITITPDTSMCPGENVQLNASGGATYLWSPNLDISNVNIPNPVVNPSSTITYNLEVEDVNGCIINETVDVIVNVPADPQAGNDASICVGDNASIFAQNGVTYSWSPTAGLDNSNIANPTASPLTSTIYTITIVDVNGCSNTDQVSINVVQPPNVNAGADISIYEDDRALLVATGASNYEWFPKVWMDNPYSNQTIIYPPDTITYYVEGWDLPGCSAVDSVNIFVLEKPRYYVPSAFTPNGDGKNDLFKVEFPYNFNLISLRVFNRWGQIVFETTNISQPWDGTIGGEPLPIDSYIYILEAIDDIGTPIRRQGNITLIK